jgi:hypothetical protein
MVGEEAAPGEHLDLVRLASPELMPPYRPADEPLQLTAEPHDRSAGHATDAQHLRREARRLAGETFLRENTQIDRSDRTGGLSEAYHQTLSSDFMKVSLPVES